MKLAQLEQELKHVRQQVCGVSVSCINKMHVRLCLFLSNRLVVSLLQGIYLGDSSHLALPGSVSSGL